MREFTFNLSLKINELTPTELICISKCGQDFYGTITHIDLGGNDTPKFIGILNNKLCFQSGPNLLVLPQITPEVYKLFEKIMGTHVLWDRSDYDSPRED